MDLRKTVSVLSFAAALATVDVVMAQAQPRPAQPGSQIQAQPGTRQGQPAQSGERANRQNTDQVIAACVAIENQEEVAIAKFAQSKTDNKDVKDFAEMLISDHQAFIEKLERFAPEVARQSLDSDRSSTDRGQQTTSTQNSGVQRAGGAQPAQPGRIQQTAGTQSERQADMIEIHRDIAQQCLSDTKKMLSDKSEAEFDKCFLGLQVAKHASMKSKLTALQNHSSGELKELLQSGAKTTEEHLEHAEKLLKQLAENKSESRRDKSERDKSE